MAIVRFPVTAVLDDAITVDTEHDNASYPAAVTTVIVQNTSPYRAQFTVSRYRANGTVQNTNSFVLEPGTPAETRISVPGNRYFYDYHAEMDMVYPLFAATLVGLASA